MSNRNPPKNFIDLSGKRYGRLIVLERDFSKTCQNRAFWLCLCDCGNKVIVMTSSLASGNTKSCGCYKLDRLVSRSTKHGLSGGHGKYTRLYQIWLHMRSRCLRKKDLDFAHYGGRGITIWKEWDDYRVFHDWAMENGYRNDLTLDRINNDGGYCPENCRWATRKRQGRNKRNNRLITFRGKTMSVAEWDEELCLDGTLNSRLHRGWSETDALTTPKGKRRRITITGE